MRKDKPELRKRIERIMQRYGKRILERPEFEQAMHQTHHRRTTVGKHTLHVAAAAIGICILLDKIHVHVKEEDVVNGALLHDLGILGRAEKYKNNHECLRKHAEDSVETAKKIIPDLNANTEDIIRNHMWPFSGTHPKTKEAVIVSAADKIASVRDWVSR